jgi:uncharacterized protein (TIGR03083 family)
VIGALRAARVLDSPIMRLVDEVIAALRSGHDRLVAALPELDLGGPLAASEWTVAQVLSHLGSGAEISRAAVERALAGGGAAPEDFNPGVWARWDAMSPADQRDGFVAANELLVERYESLDAGQRAGLRVDLGFLPAPVSVADAGRLRLSEFTLHAWDVRPGGALAAEAVPLLLDAFAPMLGWIAKPGALPGRVVLAVSLSDPGAEYALTLAPEGVALVEGAPSSPDGEVRAPAEAWLRLLTGRLAPERTPAGVSVSGPVSLDDLRRVFPGF